MAQQPSGYWKRLWMAMCGRLPPEATVTPVAPAVPVPPETSATTILEVPVTTAAPAPEWQARLAALEMDLRERNALLERMKQEYAALEQARDRTAASAGQEELERLFKKLAGPLSTLTTLASAAESGKNVIATDMAQLVRGVEKPLAAAGLEPIGAPGQKTGFEVALHQRMSGGTVREGTPVTVHIPGYRLGQKIIQKAMVSAKED